MADGHYYLPFPIRHFLSAIRHFLSAISYPPFAIRHLLSAIRHSPFAIRHPPFAICYPPFAIRHPPSAICYWLTLWHTVAMSWLFGKHDESVFVRLAEPTDRTVLSALLADTWRRQGLLALEDQAALLRNGVSALAFSGARAVGFLGLSPRAPSGNSSERWADLSLAAVAPDYLHSRMLTTLLEAALSALRANGVTGLVCLTNEGWLRDGLSAAGFVQVDRVISYVHNSHGITPAPTAVASLRSVGGPDADVLLSLNAAAFEPFWVYDDATVLSWIFTSDHAMLAELEGQVVGFALTTWNHDTDYAYLIRVAILPACQGRGIGRQLVADALQYARNAGAGGLALNTQATNVVSRHVYESLGFRATGQALAVMVYLT